MLNEIGKECLSREVVNHFQDENEEYYGDDFDDLLFYSLELIE